MTVASVEVESIDPLLRVDQVAKLLGIQRAKVYQLMESRDLEWVELIGVRGRRIPTSAVRKYLERSRRKGADE